LEDVPDSTRSGQPLLIDDLVSECEQAGAVYDERDQRVNMFDTTVQQQYMDLADVMIRRSSFKDMLSTACAIRDVVSKDLFKESMYQVILIRDDVGYLFPMSQEFLPTNFASGAKEMVEAEVGKGDGLLAVIDVNRDEGPYQTLPDSEPESRLWYFREDPAANSHHNFWHSLFATPTLDRRGEMFFFMHRQMLARYNIERMTNGLPPTLPLTSDLWTSPIPLGYDPKLQAEAGTNFQSRPNNMVMADLSGPLSGAPNFVGPLLSDLRGWFAKVGSSIGNRRLEAANGTMIPLRYVNGRDEGIPVLGDAMEDLNSVNKPKYGGIHNQGHNFIARITDPDGALGHSTGVMFNPATAMRDPVFYRWHSVVDGIFFNQYKTGLGPYTDTELSFPGVTIVESKVSTVGRNNQLWTMFDDVSVQLYGSAIQADNSFMARYKRLNHFPFEYEFVVNSDSDNVKAKVRIYLIPKDTPNPKSPLVVEMDKFLVTLTKGRNKITRKDLEAVTAGKRQRTLLELEIDLSSNVDGINTVELDELDGCGWPQHLMVPKGTPSGKEFTMVVMLSQLLPGDAALSANQEQVDRSAYAFCGLGSNNLVPDSRPMGFPFDRPVTWEMAGRGNMKMTAVKIFHQDHA